MREQEKLMDAGSMYEVGCWRSKELSVWGEVWELERWLGGESVYELGSQGSEELVAQMM